MKKRHLLLISDVCGFIPDLADPGGDLIVAQANSVPDPATTGGRYTRVGETVLACFVFSLYSTQVLVTMPSAMLKSFSKTANSLISAFFPMFAFFNVLLWHIY